MKSGSAEQSARGWREAAKRGDYMDEGCETCYWRYYCVDFDLMCEHYLEILGLEAREYADDLKLRCSEYYDMLCEVGLFDD